VSIGSVDAPGAEGLFARHEHDVGLRVRRKAGKANVVVMKVV
jgi:hypothetical protein